MEEKTLSHTFGQEGMQVPFAKEDPLIDYLPPIDIEDEEQDGGYSAVTSKAYLVPHVEGGGAHAPTRGFPVALQEGP